jgi:hypothetical protein
MSTEMIEKPKEAWILKEQDTGLDSSWEWHDRGITFDLKVAEDWIKPRKHRLPRVASRVEVKYQV